MPSWNWKDVALLAGVTAMYFTCPSTDTFPTFFETWYNDVLWRLIEQEMKEFENNDVDENSNDATENNLLKWVKSTVTKAAKAVTVAVLKNGFFHACYTLGKVEFETYHIFRIAKLTMFYHMSNQPQQMPQLVFIGVGNKWFLHPVQTVLFHGSTVQTTLRIAAIQQ
eukprot:55257_1